VPRVTGELWKPPLVNSTSPAACANENPLCSAASAHYPRCEFLFQRFRAEYKAASPRCCSAMSTESP
jgi:hypothetical protein